MERQPAAPYLEPLRFGEIIDAGFRLWRKGFKELFIIAAIITVPVGILGYLIERTQVLAIGSAGEIFVRDTGRYTAAILSITALSLGASLISGGAVLVVTTRAYLGSVPRWKDAFRVTVDRLFPFAGLAIMIGVAVIIGFVFLVIPGIIIGLGLTFAPVAFWAEGTAPRESMRRSSKLAQGRRWVLFGLWIVGFVAYSVAGVVIAGPVLAAMFTSNTELYLLVDNIGNALIGALMSPLASCLITAAYYDARVRREGFDLQFAASQLDVEVRDEPDDPYSPIIR